MSLESAQNNQVPSQALAARAVLEQIVERGKAAAGPVIERVLNEVPRDYVARAGAFRFQVRDTGELLLRLHQPGDEQELTVHGNARAQLAERAGVPERYLDSLLVHNSGERQIKQWRRELAERILTSHFGNDPAKYLVRSVGGQARGVLSDRFKRLDSRPLLDAFVQACGRIGAVPYEGTASAVRVAVKAIVPRVFEPVPGEALVFGLEWGNSDYGRGPLSISAFVLPLICLNGAVGANQLRKVHVGGRLDEGLEFSRRTYELDTKTMVSATADVVRGALEPRKIEVHLEAVRQAHEQTVDFATAFRRLSKELTKAELDAAKAAAEGPDVVMLPAGQSAWRLSNALSWIANQAQEPERKLELQRLAGDVLPSAA